MAFWHEAKWEPKIAAVKLKPEKIAQLVEHCNDIAEVMGSNHFQAWLFSVLNFATV